jgi:effector-binding domain-containing protein
VRPGAPEIVLRPAQPYLGIRGTVADGGIRAFADQAFPELFAWLGRHAVAPGGPPFLRYYEVDHAGEPLEVEAGVPVENEASGDGRIRADALPAGRYLTLLHVGPYTSDSMPDLGDAREELLGWARDNEIVYGTETKRGLALPCALEHFRIGPVDDPDFTKWETEFAYLIR